MSNVIRLPVRPRPAAAPAPLSPAPSPSPEHEGPLAAALRPRCYSGLRQRSGRCDVYVEPGSVILNPRRDLGCFTLGGFTWGGRGPGDLQLALALLADALGDDARAKALAPRFRWAVVAKWQPHEPWSLTAEHVRMLAEAIETAITAPVEGA